MQTLGSTAPHRTVFAVGACALFLLIALSLSASGMSMFADADPLWHIAAGDLIREHGRLPVTDPWSFTAGDYPWLNISWLWDCGLSYLHQHFGWHGAVAINALICGLVFALIFMNCLIRSDDLIAATLATMGTFLVIQPLLRPLQVTNLMMVLWLLILSSTARRECSARWLILLPLLMLPWVNMHGGFAAGGMMLLAFFAQALHQRDTILARWLLMAGLASLAAIFCNPLGGGIIEAFWRVMDDTAKPIINEWQPVSLSAAGLLENVLAIAFIVMVPGRALPVLACERWLAYFWLVMGVISARHMSIFVIVAAPVLSCAIQRSMSASKATPNAQAVILVGRLLKILNHRTTLTGLLALCLLAALWLPTHSAARFYKQEKFDFPTFAEETRFLKTHYPHARLLTEFYISSLLIYETRGGIPVFIDPRTQTAIPPQVIKDYTAFLNGAPGWEDMMSRYRLDGAILPNNPHVAVNPALLDRLSNRKGWREVYKGPNATIFMYSPK